MESRPAGYFRYHPSEFPAMSTEGLAQNLEDQRDFASFADKFSAVSLGGVLASIMLGVGLRGSDRVRRPACVAAGVGLVASAVGLISGIASAVESRRNIILMQQELNKRARHSALERVVKAG